jgi:nucleotide-binding universal stress UspA family protein
MEIKKILWAFDGSKESEYALGYADLLARSYDSVILGLSVIQPVDTSKMNVPSEVKKELSSIESGREKKQLERMKRALASLKLDEARCDVRAEVGTPDEQILRVAREERADLIVMGKRGLGLIDRILVGSTTLKVLKKSDIPVLAVKDKGGIGPVEIRSILVPLDISEKLDSALVYAIELAQKLDSRIFVLFVLRLESYAYEIPSGILTEDLMSVLEYLLRLSSLKLSKRVDDAKRKLGILGNETFGVEIKTEAINGLNPAISIADYASRNGIDLVVINTHGRKGIKRFILGSVTEKVIQESPCPVLVLKP